jgi:Chaperone of endosialidase
MMKGNKHMRTKTKFTYAAFITLVLACFALSPTARALLPPPAPDGGYPNSNTAEGTGALYHLTTGSANTANGASALITNTTGSRNTATGQLALFLNYTGHDNTATGVKALENNFTGNYNTATGVNALLSNTEGNRSPAGSNNTATGYDALYSNTTTNGVSGNYNTATGVKALYTNATGSNNTANGVQALYSNTTGFSNTATGVNALYHNTTGAGNTASGLEALVSNTNGANNTANGYHALFTNPTGAGNTASGFEALYNNTGSFNIGLGNQAGKNLTFGSRNIDIGNGGVTGESNTIRIGNVQTATYIVGISGQTATGGAAVFVASDGKLGTLTSSRRFKKDIADMDAASEALLALRPVTFRYKPELDKAGVPQYGLVAEEVAEVNPDLVLRDEKGEIYTVRYEAVNAMLLNEFLKEHRKVEEQQTTISELKSTATKQQASTATQEATITGLKKAMDVLTAQLKDQGSQIQKVSAQLDMRKPASQVVLNNR